MDSEVLDQTSSGAIDAFPLAYGEGEGGEKRSGFGPWAHKIDREQRVIRDVKIAGMVSVNPGRVMGFDDDRPYRYSERAMLDAVPLYEGLPVYCDHPPMTLTDDGERIIDKGDRKLGDKFGRIVNVRFEPGTGLFGDLEYLETHPLCRMVLEAAEWMPEQVALSHNVTELYPRQTESGVVVERIASVRSVDLIGERPGTTKSLFESASVAGKSIRKAKEPHMATATDEKKVAAEQGGGTDEELLKATAEEETPLDEELRSEEAAEEEEEELPKTTAEEGEVEEPAAEESIASGYKKAIVDLLSDDSIDAETLKEKVNAIIDQMIAARDLMNGGDSATDEPASAGAAESAFRRTKDAAARRVIAQLAAENALLKKQDKARRALVESGIANPKAFMVNAVSRCSTDAERKALVESFRSSAGVKGASRTKSAAPGGRPVVESTASASRKGTGKEETREELANRLRSGAYQR